MHLGDAEALQRGTMFRSGVALVAGEAVAGESLVEFAKQAVAVNFGDDAGVADASASSIIDAIECAAISASVAAAERLVGVSQYLRFFAGVLKSFLLLSYLSSSDEL